MLAECQGRGMLDIEITIGNKTEPVVDAVHVQSSGAAKKGLHLNPWPCT